jgi:hypothetical protein
MSLSSDFHVGDQKIIIYELDGNTIVPNKFFEFNLLLTSS